MAVLLELLNKQNSKFNTSFSATRVFPPLEEGGVVVAENIFLKDDKVNFDLMLQELPVEEYESIRVIPLNEKEIATLDSANFPVTINESSRVILFEDSPDNVVFQPLDSLEDIQIGLKELTEDDFVILIVLEDAPENNSDIFILTLNKGLLVQTQTAHTQDYKDVFDETFPNVTNLQIVEDKTYTSNLLYSCDTEGMFTGLYCVDKAKLVQENVKFPSLIPNDTNEEFSEFLYDSEVYIYKYEKDKAGYNFVSNLTTASAKPVDDVLAANTGGYRFYQFTTYLNDYVSDLQVVVKFYLNDITINLAKQAIVELKILRDTDNRADAAVYFANIYGEDFLGDFGVSIFDVEKLSNLDFQNLANRVIGDLQDKIDNASQKVVVNEDLRSQYTSPKFVNSTYYRGVFEQKFEEKINLSNKELNQILPNISMNNGFLSISSEAASNLFTTEQEIQTESVQQFQIIPNELQINKFILTSSKDKTIVTEGLQNKVNLSDSDEKSQRALSESEPQKFLNFISKNTRDVKLYYLKQVGESVSALIFSEIDDDFPDLETLEGRVLVRMDNYQEFYNSYFYVLGTQG